MMFLKIASYNFKLGILARYKLYLVFVILVLLQLIFITPQFYNAILEGKSIGFFDLLIHILYGSAPFNKETGEKFIIPISWSFLMLYIAYVNQDYLTLNTYECNQTALLKTQSRGHWWVGKCFWIVISSIIEYLIVCLTIITYLLIVTSSANLPKGDMFLPPQNIIANSDASFLNIIFVTIIVPIACIICISLLQFNVQLFIEPVISYISVVVFTVASIYFHCHILFLNGMMMQRNSLFVKEGIQSKYIFFINIFVTLFLFFLGLFFVHKIDFLKNKRSRF